MPKPLSVKLTNNVDTQQDAQDVIRQLTDNETAIAILRLPVAKLRTLRRVVAWLEQDLAEQEMPRSNSNERPSASAGGSAADA